MFKIIFLIIITIFISSCTPLYYPNLANVSSYFNKGDINLELYVVNDGTEMQTGYAFTNNYYLILNGAYIDISNSEDIL